MLGFFQDPYLSDCNTGREEPTSSVLQTAADFGLSHIQKHGDDVHTVKPELCVADLPDVVVDGVLQGFYPRDVRVSFTAPTLAVPDPATSIDD